MDDPIRVINTATVEHRHHRALEFTLAETEEGQFLAYRRTEPLFCFEHSTLEGAAEVAKRAIDSWVTEFTAKLQPR